MTLRVSSTGTLGNTSTLGYTTGTATPTGNGITTVFNIAHGLGKIPSFCYVNAGNALSAALYTIAWDNTNIIVTFIIAPNGALSIRWKAEG